MSKTKRILNQIHKCMKFLTNSGTCRFLIQLELRMKITTYKPRSFPSSPNLLPKYSTISSYGRSIDNSKGPAKVIQFILKNKSKSILISPSSVKSQFTIIKTNVKASRFTNFYWKPIPGAKLLIDKFC